MQALLDSLSPPWLGTVVGLLGLVAAAVSYFGSKRTPRLAYHIDEFTVVGGDDSAFPPEIEIRFASSVVNRVTVSRFVIWNAGNTTLTGSQIVAADPIRFQLESSGKVLRARVAALTREVVDARLDRETATNGFVRLRFDFLDPRDGVAVELLHSGQPGDLVVRGTLRELPNGFTNCGPVNVRLAEHLFGPFAHVIRLRTVLVLTFAMGVGTIAFGLGHGALVRALQANKTPASDSSPIQWMLVLAGAAYAALPLYLAWVRRKRYPAILDRPTRDVARSTHSPTGTVIDGHTTPTSP